MIPIIFGSLGFQLGNPNRWKIFRGQKYAYIHRLNTKIRLTVICLSGFELYSRWVLLFKDRNIDASVYFGSSLTRCTTLVCRGRTVDVTEEMYFKSVMHRTFVELFDGGNEICWRFFIWRMMCQATPPFWPLIRLTLKLGHCRKGKKKESI